MDSVGSHARVCPEGHVREVHYNSCAHRACPQCSWDRMEEWLESKHRQLLGCDHYHLTVTLPDVFRPLWQFSRRRFAGLLFRTALEVVQELMAERYGVRPGVLASLHTWTRTLVAHPRVASGARQVFRSLVESPQVETKSRHQDHEVQPER